MNNFGDRIRGNKRNEKENHFPVFPFAPLTPKNRVYNYRMNARALDNRKSRQEKLAMRFTTSVLPAKNEAYAPSVRATRTTTVAFGVPALAAPSLSSPMLGGLVFKASLTLGAWNVDVRATRIKLHTPLAFVHLCALACGLVRPRAAKQKNLKCCTNRT